MNALKIVYLVIKQITEWNNKKEIQSKDRLNVKAINFFKLVVVFSSEQNKCGDKADSLVPGLGFTFSKFTVQLSLVSCHLKIKQYVSLLS